MALAFNRILCGPLSYKMKAHPSMRRNSKKVKLMKSFRFSGQTGSIALEPLGFLGLSNELI